MVDGGRLSTGSLGPHGHGWSQIGEWTGVVGQSECCGVDRKVKSGGLTSLRRMTDGRTSERTSKRADGRLGKRADRERWPWDGASTAEAN